MFFGFVLIFFAIHSPCSSSISEIRLISCFFSDSCSNIRKFDLRGKLLSHQNIVHWLSVELLFFNISNNYINMPKMRDILFYGFKDSRNKDKWLMWFISIYYILPMVIIIYQRLIIKTMKVLEVIGFNLVMQTLTLSALLIIFRRN